MVSETVARAISRGLVFLIAILAGGTLGRMAGVVRYQRITSLPPRDLLRVPGVERLILVFQPADCVEGTEPIARMFRRISQVRGIAAIGVMLDAPATLAEAEAAAINGGIDFPVLVRNDWRGMRLLERLGFTSTPVALILSQRGELRYARSGDIPPEDWPLITRIAAEEN